MKECSRCNKLQNIEEFNKSKANKDGHRTWCKTCLAEYKIQYSKDNRCALKEYSQKYKVVNRQRLLLKEKQRRDKNPLLKLTSNIRSSIGTAIREKGVRKTLKTQVILGCSFEDFKKYIESKFEPWMTWDNYGRYNGTINYGWDIDHIIPLSSANTENSVLELSHFSNLQPLCSYINRVIKKDKIRN